MMLSNYSTSRKKILIIGMGSIGVRHKCILSELGCDVKILSTRPGVGDFKDLTSALMTSFDLIAITNDTSKHIDTLLEISRYCPSLPIFIEKPLANSLKELSEVIPPALCWIGYNLRFNPILTDIKNFLTQKNNFPYYAHFHVGQDLVTWRPERDPGQSYSYYKSLGGGVVKDLSHEIDLALWLFGEWVDIKSSVSKVSNKTIDTEDIALVVATTKQGSLMSINMNYLDLIPVRIIQISGPDYFIKADLNKSELEINNYKTFYSNAKDESYISMWKAAISLSTETQLCTFEEAFKVQQMIEAIYANKIS